MCGSDRRVPRAPARQRGLSIIELMVGIVVALLISLAASSSAMLFTAAQRQSVSAGGGAVNAAEVLAQIKNDAAQAGLGFFDSRALCETINLSVGANLLNFRNTFTPVRVTAQASGSDTLDVVYGMQIESGNSVRLAAASDATSVRLASLLPAAEGQAVLLAPDKPSAGPCIVRTTTSAVPATDTAAQLLNFESSGLHNQFTMPETLSFATGDRATLLGELRWNRYELDGTFLTIARRPQNDSAVLVRNVMAFRVQYGISAAGGGTTLESWQDASGADFGALTQAAMTRVRALRIGVVVRAPQREKPAADGSCSATAELPQLFGTTITPDVADWACYRFRSATVVVPLRNLVLGMAAP